MNAVTSKPDVSKNKLMKPTPEFKLSKTTRIGVLYGGMASEREVSLRSGKNCFEALKRLGYEKAKLIDVDQNLAQSLKAENIELAFLALHGKYGEDGCVQGLLEVMGIPYTGNGVAASALTWNKARTKAVLAAAGLPVLPSVEIEVGEIERSDVSMGQKQGQPCPEKYHVSGLNYPVIVKPLSEGSSYGMSKVEKPEDLQAALLEAGRYGHHVMIEEFIRGKSITVGVIDIDGTPTVTPILEMRPVKSDWYDLEAKYTQGLTQFILPAELSEEVTRAIQDITLQAHKAADCHGVSRIDFVVSENPTAKSGYYILEVNTIPGMTDLSDLPAQAGAMGISYDQLVEHILKTALTRLS
ncbi:MAG: D-alanine--D-alanine ligase [Vampirovibrionales bacterium]|nr:D-alanine--D-alanine ligase [Vampirovibrionales bacterium]